MKQISLPRHSCKGYCNKNKVSINKKSGAGIYTNGFKYCGVCEGYFKTDVIYCDCCGTSLRSKAR